MSYQALPNGLSYRWRATEGFLLAGSAAAAVVLALVLTPVTPVACLFWPFALGGCWVAAAWFVRVDLVLEEDTLRASYHPALWPGRPEVALEDVSGFACRAVMVDVDSDPHRTNMKPGAWNVVAVRRLEPDVVLVSRVSVREDAEAMVVHLQELARRHYDGRARPASGVAAFASSLDARATLEVGRASREWDRVLVAADALLEMDGSATALDVVLHKALVHHRQGDTQVFRLVLKLERHRDEPGFRGAVASLAEALRAEGSPEEATIVLGFADVD